MRLQEYGVGIFIETQTKTSLKKVLKKGLILVDDKIATSATMITGGERILLKSSPTPISKKPFDLSLKILFEDEHLAAVSKPAGILVSGNRFNTIANALQSNLSMSQEYDACKAQPVHRLDFATTGILLVGKTSSSIRALNKLFENKEISKSYFAISIGDILEEGAIEKEIDGKKAYTQFKKIDEVSSDRFETLSLLKLHPKTGRRHQLRKHLASLGNPILGDVDYGIENLILKGKGLYLHAHSLEFIHPFTGDKVHIEDPLPKRFLKIFEDFKS